MDTTCVVARVLVCLFASGPLITIRMRTCLYTSDQHPYVRVLYARVLTCTCTFDQHPSACVLTRVAITFVHACLCHCLNELTPPVCACVCVPTFPTANVCLNVYVYMCMYVLERVNGSDCECVLECVHLCMHVLERASTFPIVSSQGNSPLRPPHHSWSHTLLIKHINTWLKLMRLHEALRPPQLNIKTRLGSSS